VSSKSVAVNTRRQRLKVDKRGHVLATCCRLTSAHSLFGSAGTRGYFTCFKRISSSGHKLSGPIVISHDHHDVSGTDSPFRETSNVYDGSAFTAVKENGFHLVFPLFKPNKIETFSRKFN
jgi:hypothetical protein